MTWVPMPTLSGLQKRPRLNQFHDIIPGALLEKVLDQAVLDGMIGDDRQPSPLGAGGGDSL
jgi:hypothetical protein